MMEKKKLTVEEQKLHEDMLVFLREIEPIAVKYDIAFWPDLSFKFDDEKKIRVFWPDIRFGRRKKSEESK